MSIPLFKLRVVVCYYLFWDIIMRKVKVGKCKLYRGDCLDLLKKLPKKSVDLIVTDPPYWHNKGCMPTKSDKAILSTPLYSRNGDMLKKFSSFNPKRIKSILEEFPRIMKLMNCYLFCNDSQLPTYGKWAEKHGYKFSVLVWRKPLSVINKNRFSTNVEFIARIYENGTGLNKVDNNTLYDRVKNDTPVRGSQKKHPTQKPTSLIDKIIKLSSKKKNVILDPFMGSGTTGVSCQRLKRKFIGCEIEKKYFKVAIKRLKEEKFIKLF